MENKLIKYIQNAKRAEVHKSEINRFQKYLDLLETQTDAAEQEGNTNLVSALASFWDYYNKKKLIAELNYTEVKREMVLFELNSYLPF